ncbi:hypothetical protein PAXINDRAFT_16088 [Paxillus involutus ATCC 200175]|uniref:Uncharacterized protein n=1 Tax=Paxillus involutus ATCC 200175 TaxID=664439 RepID=A0A0C9TJT5_PAXIN|nr:hypothetical protein PAXINDRAFT_16088 [Paxillus involutus ATCC 200175]
MHYTAIIDCTAHSLVLESGFLAVLSIFPSHTLCLFFVIFLCTFRLLIPSFDVITIMIIGFMTFAHASVGPTVLEYVV